jgi:hypothetical protein
MTQTFSRTSDAPYDRHNYEVVLKNSKKVFFEHWEDVQAYWWSNCQIPDFLDYVIVKDKKKINKGGFGK